MVFAILIVYGIAVGILIIVALQKTPFFPERYKTVRAYMRPHMSAAVYLLSYPGLLAWGFVFWIAKKISEMD